MLAIIFLLIIVPILLGCLIQKLLKLKTPNFSGFYFILGFLVMVAEFALICYPAIYLDAPFHIVIRIVFLLYILESVAILIWLVFTKQINLAKFYSKDAVKSYLCSPAFWLMIALCGFQIIRVALGTPYQVRDSKTYNAIVNDILQTDHLFRTFQTSGFPFASVLSMKLRFTLSPWYPFMSMLAGLSKLHPLIICNTIMPTYVLFLDYLTLYMLGVLLFEGNINYTCFFTTLCAFIHEVTLYCHTPTMINLVWPMWGKGVLSCIIVPALLILYMLCNKKHSHIQVFWVYILIVFISIAGCSMSTMAGLVIPLEVGIMGLIQALRKHSVRSMICSIIACFPCFIYLTVYYYLSCLQQLG